MFKLCDKTEKSSENWRDKIIIFQTVHHMLSKTNLMCLKKGQLTIENYEVDSLMSYIHSGCK
jgi:hypothetical protein